MMHILRKMYFEDEGDPRFEENVKTWIDRFPKQWYQMTWNTFGAATWDQWKKSLEAYFCRKRWTHSTHAFDLNGLLGIPAAPSPLKRFLEPSDIETASSPFIEDVVYVDKTNHILNLFQTGKRYFFVRPRRFGKSSFLQTLRRILDGTGRGVFNGTFIHASNYNWDSAYPVLYLDLGQYVVEDDDTCPELMRIPRSLTKLEKKVNMIFTEFKTAHNLSKPCETDLPAEFHSILKEVNENGNHTVVLIDEYDFSILNNMPTCPVAAKINTILVRNIFLQLKDYASLMKFAFVTGISKAAFSILGTASDLKDITHNPDFHNIAGLTESDLKDYYCDHIEAASNHLGESGSKVIGTLKEWYDGYNFSTRVRSSLYNPLSVHSYLENKVARGYWTDKDHARFLYQQMVHRPEQFSCLDLIDGVQSELRGSRSLNVTDPVVLLYDAGYLTIQGFKNGYYTLGFPNQEMERAFYVDIAGAAMEREKGIGIEVDLIRTALKKPIPNFKGFINAINSGMEKLAMRAPFEQWYDWQTMLFMKYAGMNAERQCDIPIVPSALNDYKNIKKVDVTGYNEDTFFLFEVKFERHGCFEAWNGAKQSIQAHLDRNKKEEKPLNILAAGITFTADRTKKPVMSYKAKLFAPNGKVLRPYFSSTRIKSDPKSDESFVAEKMSI